MATFVEYSPYRHQDASWQRRVQEWFSPIQELTGQVTRTDHYSFASGGNAEVFKGEYLGRTVSLKFFTLSFCFQLRLPGGSQGF